MFEKTFKKPNENANKNAFKTDLDLNSTEDDVIIAPIDEDVEPPIIIVNDIDTPDSPSSKSGIDESEILGSLAKEQAAEQDRLRIAREKVRDEPDLLEVRLTALESRIAKLEADKGKK